MQRAEMEELRQREANMTALQAIGVRKKPRLDLPGTTGSFNQVSLLINQNLVLDSFSCVYFTLHFNYTIKLDEIQPKMRKLYRYYHLVLLKYIE